MGNKQQPAPTSLPRVQGTAQASGAPAEAAASLAAPTPSWRRRDLLRGALPGSLAGLAALGLVPLTAGCGTRFVRDPRADAALLSQALEVVYQVRHAYLRAAALLPARERALAASIRAQEAEQAAQLGELIGRLGRRPPRPLLAAEYDAQLPALANRSDALRLLRDAEDLEVRTHLLAFARVSAPELRPSALRLACAHAGHGMLIASLRGERAPERAFVTGRPRS